MKKMSLIVISAYVLLGCASRNTSPSASEFLSDSLSHPSSALPLGVLSRYWSHKNFLIHFVTNVTEKTKDITPVIYIHGLGASLEGYAGLINEIHYNKKINSPFYALDLPPFGKSALLRSDVVIHDYTEMLRDFILMLGVPKVNLVCHSMGGQVCIDYALDNPSQIQLLTLISPAGIFDRSEFVSSISSQFARVNVGQVDSPNARTLGDLFWYDQEFTRRMLTDNPSVLVGIEVYRFNLHERVKDLQTKTLIIWGREDKIFSFENGLFLKENIENSTLYVLDGAGHGSFKENPKLVANLILKYL